MESPNRSYPGALNPPAGVPADRGRQLPGLAVRLPDPHVLQQARQGRPLRRLGGARVVRERGSRSIPVTPLAERARVTPQAGLREAGAHKQAAALTARLSATGMFELFLEHKGAADQFRFGREADGTPAAPWGWEDLDLWLVPRLRAQAAPARHL